MDEETGAATDPGVLLAEYQAAQDSAQHHDQLVWTITSILWGSSLVLLGLVVGSIDKFDMRLPMTVVAVAAIALTVYLWSCARQLRQVKVQKYRRCVAIENQLGMQQHRSLKYSVRSQTRGYSAVMTVFLAMWIALIVWVWVKPV